MELRRQSSDQNIDRDWSGARTHVQCTELKPQRKNICHRDLNSSKINVNIFGPRVVHAFNF